MPHKPGAVLTEPVLEGPTGAFVAGGQHLPQKPPHRKALSPLLCAASLPEASMGKLV